MLRIKPPAQGDDRTSKRTSCVSILTKPGEKKQYITCLSLPIPAGLRFSQPPACGAPSHCLPPAAPPSSPPACGAPLPPPLAAVGTPNICRNDHAEDVISLVLSCATILSFSAPQGFCIRPDQEWSLQLISI